MIYKKLLSGILVSFFLTHLIAQNDSIAVVEMYSRADKFSTLDLDAALLVLDSLDELMEVSGIDDIRWKALVLRGNVYKSLDRYDTTLHYYNLAEKEVKKIGALDKLPNVHLNRASVYQYLNKDSLAIEVFHDVIATSMDTSNQSKRYTSFAYYSIGNIYKGNNDSLAVYNYILGEEIANKIGYKDLQGAIYYKLATIFKNQREYDKSIEQLEKCLENYGEDHIEMLKVYEVWGKCLQYKGQPNKAQAMFEKILESKNTTKRNSVFALNSLSILLKEQGKFQESIDALEKALPLTDGEDHMSNKRGQILANLAGVYFDLGNFEKSLNYYERSKPFILDNPNARLANKTYLLESIVNTKINLLGDQRMVDEFDEFVKYNDSMMTDIRESTANDLLAKYQSDIKDAENEKLQEEKIFKEATISRQKKYLLGGGLGLALISLMAVSLFRQREKQKLLNKEVTSSRDQIKLLNKELNHRVKNNLAFMTSLLEMQGRRSESKEAKQILIESKSRLKALALVHSNLFKNDNDTEINLKIYLEEIVVHLQNIFELPNRSLEIDTSFIDHTIDAEEAMRIGLIINEMVTNSVKHAFLDVENPHITIETSEGIDHKIVLTYKDNGPGLSKIISETSLSSESMGTKLIALLQEQLEDTVELKMDY